MNIRLLTLGILSLSVLKISAQTDSISVLFIGNSYTYVNDLPGTLRNLATERGKTVFTGEKTNGGFTFQMQASDVNTYTAIHQQPWDVVVLQGQSQEPSFEYAQVNSQTIPPAKQLADSVFANNSCGNVMYYMTWGREVGDPQWDSINTFDKMNSRLYDAYLRIADSSRSALVSPVAKAWKYVRDNYPTIQLYQSDGSHPSLAGTYLAALTFYYSLFNEDPNGTTFLGGLDQQTANALQAAVSASFHPFDPSYHWHNIHAPTYANFAVIQNNQEIHFLNLSAQATAYAWNFGDGNVSTNEHPDYIYLTPGVFTVELTANSACNSDTISTQITVLAVGLNEYPNPELKILVIGDQHEFQLNAEGLEIKAFDLNGKELIVNPLSTTVYRMDKTAGLKLVQVLKNGEVVQLIKLY